MVVFQGRSGWAALCLVACGDTEEDGRALQSPCKDTLYYLVGELARSCQFGVGRQVFAFIIINHCSSTFRNGLVMMKCCSGSSRWSRGRQMAWQEGGDWNELCFQGCLKVGSNAPALAAALAGACPRRTLAPCGCAAHVSSLRWAARGSSPGEVRAGHRLSCQPLPR